MILCHPHFSLTFTSQLINAIISLSILLRISDIHTTLYNPVLCPQKVHLFGVCCEAIPRQVNYLIDEAYYTGKGANTVINLLHNYLCHHSIGEKQLHLHADNCVGQNKNNYLLRVSVITKFLYSILSLNLVLCLAGFMWPIREHHSFLCDSWAHQVFSRLVFRPTEAKATSL